MKDTYAGLLAQNDHKFQDRQQSTKPNVASSKHGALGDSRQVHEVSPISRLVL